MSGHPDGLYDDLVRELVQNVLDQVGRGVGGEELAEYAIHVTSDLAGQRLDDLGALHYRVGFARADLLASRQRRLMRWEEPLELMQGLDLFLRGAARWHLAASRARMLGRLDERTRILEGLHARVLRTLAEVICLLEGGYVDGAHARCRTLHELAVTTRVILGAAEDTLRRYQDYKDISALNQAEAHAKHADMLNEAPPTEEELRRLRERRDRHIATYGRGFASPFGWAANLRQGKESSYVALERHAGLDHNRAYYLLACVNVHPDPRGLAWSMGLPEDVTGVVSGASHTGLSLPGQSASISAMQCTYSRLLDTVLSEDIEQYTEALVSRSASALCVVKP